ncbi:hypothetical protein LCGC14_0674100 [marine sediment metagenome]|uniref:Uncharacterized protein n=1 Tax=marine sediment metagenome TaxID=412755 RepID=A0A0F9TY32_9ZZZZ
MLRPFRSHEVLQGTPSLTGTLHQRCITAAMVIVNYSSGTEFTFHDDSTITLDPEGRGHIIKITPELGEWREVPADSLS